MRKIEQRFPDDVVVIGVHSGKYIAERETSRIREASLRYDISHPIVNDRQFRIWRSYAVRAWPTLAVIDRSGYVVGAHAGEFTAEMLEPALDGLVSMPAPGRASHPAEVIEPPSIQPGVLRYPGKVAVDGRRIAIADTGNHRVIIGELDDAWRMRTTRVVTEVESNGDESTRLMPLHSPQGLTFAGDTLYVADAENHTVDAIDTIAGSGRVLAGIGSQLRSRADRERGALSSPWDLVAVQDTVYVAMAGVHQLWTVNASTGEAQVHCGTGGEDIVDGPLDEALLAQPMGIATDGRRLYFADAESSAVRWADLAATGSVGTIVGTGLFDFGDADGTGDNVRMQHQQGLAIRGGELLVADSYNDALKWVSIDTREARTWLRGLHEPGGVAIGGEHVYIADTNAHRIAVTGLSGGELRNLEIIN